MRRIGFLIFNQMLSVLSRVYIVVIVVVVVVVIFLINGICCCCWCYFSYQGSILLLLLVYIYVLMCLFSTTINKVRVTTIISQQHFNCLPLKVYINKSIFGKILSGIRNLSKLFQFLIKLFPKMVFQIVITCIHLFNPMIFFTHNTQHYRVCCSLFVARGSLFVDRKSVV